MLFTLLVVTRDLAVDVQAYDDLNRALDEIRVHMDRPGVVAVKLFTVDWVHIISVDRGVGTLQTPMPRVARG